MRMLSSFVFLALLGCNPEQVSGGTLYDFNTTPFGGVNVWQGEVVDVNLDGERVGTTADSILFPPGDHEVTFGDISNSITTGDGTVLPIVTATDGRTWIAEPIRVTVDARRARHDEGHVDTALADTGAPTDTNAVVGGEPAPVFGTFLAPEGRWTCQNQDQSQTQALDVIYPNASSMDMAAFGITSILGVLLNIPDDSLTELRGNFTGDGTLTVNVIPSDGGSDVGIWDCWSGVLCDRPWDPFTDPADCAE